MAIVNLMVSGQTYTNFQCKLFWLVPYRNSFWTGGNRLFKSIIWRLMDVYNIEARAWKELLEWLGTIKLQTLWNGKRKWELESGGWGALVCWARGIERGYQRAMAMMKLMNTAPSEQTESFILPLFSRTQRKRMDARPLPRITASQRRGHRG